MDLLLIRKTNTEKSTIGDLFVNDKLECFTLEDMDRKLEDGGIKIPKKTAIPRGKYEIIIDKSRRFNTFLPHLLDVPQFEGIRFHPGNTSEDTEGCILPGEVRGVDKIFNSRMAYDKLFTKLSSAWNVDEKITITIT